MQEMKTNEKGLNEFEEKLRDMKHGKISYQSYGHRGKGVRHMKFTEAPIIALNDEYSRNKDLETIQILQRNADHRYYKELIDKAEREAWIAGDNNGLFHKQD